MKKPAKDATAAFEEALASPDQPVYELRLYVTGLTRRSTTAIRNIREICDENLKGRFLLQVIDINQQPELARGDQIIAVPTLIKELPLPLRQVVGDLSDRERVLIGLDLKPVS